MVAAVHGFAAITAFSLAAIAVNLAFAIVKKFVAPVFAAFAAVSCTVVINSTLSDAICFCVCAVLKALAAVLDSSIAKLWLFDAVLSSV